MLFRSAGLAETVVVEVTFSTTWSIAVETAARWVASPGKLAVIEWVPTESAEVATVQAPLPAEPRVQVPIAVDASRRVIVPLAAIPSTVATDAVKVTELPSREGLAELASETVAGDFRTVWVKVVEVLAARVLSPV